MLFHTIEDYKEKLNGKKVFVRIDTNATLENGQMPLTERVKSAFDTIKFLVDAGASVVAASHNGRKGDLNFVSIGPLFLLLKHQHPELPDIICPGNTYDTDYLGINSKALKTIKKMQPGEVVILENVRFLSNETAKLSREEFSKQKFVQDLIDAGVSYYILDGFSVSHRGHMSVVGFPQIPNLAGLCLKKELDGAGQVIKMLNESKTGEKKVAFILGGAKIQDYISLIENALKENTVDKILPGGVLSQLFFFAKGIDVGEGSKVPLLKKDAKGKSGWDYKERIEVILNKYPDRIELPIDVAYEMPDGTRKEFMVDEVEEIAKEKGSILDIGTKTAQKYKEILSKMNMAYWKGPLGAYDLNPLFDKGSKEVLDFLKDNKAVFSVMGGGDTGQMLQYMKVETTQLGYVSLSGGALIKILAGSKLPGIAVLEESYQKY